MFESHGEGRGSPGRRSRVHVRVVRACMRVRVSLLLGTGYPLIKLTLQRVHWHALWLNNWAFSQLCGPIDSHVFFDIREQLQTAAYVQYANANGAATAIQFFNGCWVPWDWKFDLQPV